MSRHIKFTETDISSILNGIKEQLEKKQNGLGTFVYNYTTKSEKEKVPVRIIFTPYAYYKMCNYVLNFTSEIAWQGIAEKVSEKVYKISDVFVYPQRVTAATVVTDDDKMAPWEESLDDDTYNGRFFHGHSHVNMGVSPSSTDMDMRKDILSRLGENGFYIFMIMNKNNDMSFEVYDYEDNKIYDTVDCVVEVDSFEKNPAEVKKDADAMIYKVALATPATTTYYTTNTATKAGTNAYQESMFPEKKTKGRSTKKKGLKDSTVNEYYHRLPGWYMNDLDEYENYMYGNY